jgi:hypothetical protein
MDYFYDEGGVMYSMTLELRDKGSFGFLLPASEIIPSGQETVEGLVSFWTYVKDHVDMKQPKPDFMARIMSGFQQLFSFI